IRVLESELIGAARPRNHGDSFSDEVAHAVRARQIGVVGDYLLHRKIRRSEEETAAAFVGGIQAGGGKMADIAAKCRKDVGEVRSFYDAQAYAEILCEHLEHVLFHAAVFAVGAQEA